VSLYLKSLSHPDWKPFKIDNSLTKKDNIIGNVLIHPTAKVSENALIGPDVVIGENAIVEDGARIMNSAIMKGVKVGKSSFIDGSIIGWHSKIGNWVRIEGTTVLGEDV